MKNAFFYFLIFPFYGLIQAVRSYKLPWAKDMLWLFVIFFGYTMNRPEAMDSARYVAKVQMLYENPRTWDNFLASFYSIDERGQGSVDIYEPIMANFVSLFTDNGNVVFAFFGIVYGFFFSRNVWFIVDEIKKKSKVLKAYWFLFFTFICVIGFWELNGVRMWTAAQVFFYGVFLVTIKEKKAGYLFVASSALIHFSYGLPIAIFLIYRFLKPPKNVLYILFVASFFVATLNITAISGLVQSIIPEFFMTRVNNYISDEHAVTYENMQEGIVWYIKYHKIILNYLIAIFITVINFSKSINIKSDKTFYNIYNFSLILMILGNILSILPSGDRFLLIAQYLTTAVLTLYFIRFNDKKFHRTVVLLSPFLLFFIVISLRKSFDTISIMTILTNPILATILDTPVPLIDILK